MKQLIRVYLSSLRERGELDAILPDMLSEIGFIVTSRPSVGTRQYGVDMVAVGVDRDGVKKLFLFSIKAGDLTRENWDGGPNSLRQSLDEIRDVYIGSHVPPEHAGLPIVICLCIGGEIRESVRSNVSGYINRSRERRIEYQEWNGDRIAGLLLSGVLSEELVPTKARSLFRKSVALVDETDVSWSYFCELVRFLVEECKEGDRKRMVSAARQVNLCLWVLFVWCRDGDNVESAYLSSEFAVLQVWALVAPFMEEDGVEARELKDGQMNLISLHANIAECYVDKISPHAGIRHGLATAVGSSESVDVNIKLFEVLGRMALCGLWTVFFIERSGEGEERREIRDHWCALRDRLIKNIGAMIRNNGSLVTPIKDEQAIDIGLACLFLLCVGQKAFVRRWIGRMVGAVIWAYVSNGPYPCIITDYRELLMHPMQGDDYREKSTKASVLLPSLAVWAKLTEEKDALGRLCEFVSREMEHSSMQVWFPGDDSEAVLYTNQVGGRHGRALVGLKIGKGGTEPVDTIVEECGNNTAFEELSAVRWGLWPLVLMACRQFRLPIPPQFWKNLVESGREA